ncbi:peroxisome assembly protein 12-like protein [Leptotrombidium deliense]|uniref:Peroxisome assembly protein 12 n=1 Tax=Leptotrombidium deliense TaxID=299467 RepID=A0A443SSR6_9ACAR|nr:peroxisome assembly protein 12-like protein [Leptotrombidium deliense]
MAEFGAHLTTRNNLKFSKPSIFESLAEDNLCTGLKSAFHYLSKIAAQSNPGKYSLIYEHFDEFYLLFDTLVQFTHLYVYKASFAEKVYGLRRIDKSGDLTLKNTVKSLFWLVSFPYLRSKLNTFYEKLSRDEFNGKLRRDRNKNAYLFIKVFPLLNSLWELTLLIHQITYAVQQGKNHSPLLTLSGVELVVFSQEAHESLKELNIVSRIGDLSIRFAKWIAKCFGYGLSFGAFFLQFLDYWYTRESLSPIFMSLPIPPPPKKFLSDVSCTQCPLCLGKRNQDTVLRTSGFVFCYDCIFRYVNENGKCPVSGFYSNINHLLKLFPPEK